MYSPEALAIIIWGTVALAGVGATASICTCACAFKSLYNSSKDQADFIHREVITQHVEDGHVLTNVKYLKKIKAGSEDTERSVAAQFEHRDNSTARNISKMNIIPGEGITGAVSSIIGRIPNPFKGTESDTAKERVSIIDKGAMQHKREMPGQPEISMSSNVDYEADLNDVYVSPQEVPVDLITTVIKDLREQMPNGGEVTQEMVDQVLKKKLHDKNYAFTLKSPTSDADIIIREKDLIQNNVTISNGGKKRKISLEEIDQQILSVLNNDKSDGEYEVDLGDVVSNKNNSFQSDRSFRNNDNITAWSSSADQAVSNSRHITEPTIILTDGLNDHINSLTDEKLLLGSEKL